MAEIAYILYLAGSLLMVGWVARTISSHGLILLVRCFGQSTELAWSASHVVTIGFCLFGLGVVTLTLGIGAEPKTLADLIRFLGAKLGLSSVLLGAMHFLGMRAIAQLGRKANGWLEQSDPA